MNKKLCREEIICCILADAFLDLPCEEIMPFIVQRLSEHNIKNIQIVKPLFYDLVARVVGYNLSLTMAESEKNGFSDTLILEGIRKIKDQRQQNRLFKWYSRLMTYRCRLLYHRRWHALESASKYPN